MLCQSGSLYLRRVAHHILINFLNIYWAGGSLYANSPTSVPYRHTRYRSSLYMSFGTLVRQTLLSMTRRPHLSPVLSGNQVDPVDLIGCQIRHKL